MLNAVLHSVYFWVTQKRSSVLLLSKVLNSALVSKSSIQKWHKRNT
ncbi:Uncharacterised protein [Vibrio cholerae]|nr:Uncharacterised protein [Vibrio cholerae]CSD90883.1 Uncharacterised protein [Vibrio cholerae]